MEFWENYKINHIEDLFGVKGNKRKQSILYGLVVILFVMFVHFFSSFVFSSYFHRWYEIQPSAIKQQWKNAVKQGQIEFVGGKHEHWI